MVFTNIMNNRPHSLARTYRTCTKLRLLPVTFEWKCWLCESLPLAHIHRRLVFHEPQSSPSSDTSHLQFSDYVRHLCFFLSAGFSIYIHRFAAVYSFLHFKFSNQNFQFTRLEIRPPLSNHYCCTDCRLPPSRTSPMTFYSSLLNTETDPSCQTTILGDFSAHNENKLLHSSYTSTMRRVAEDFVLVSWLKSLYIPDHISYRPYTFDMQH